MSVRAEHLVKRFGRRSEVAAVCDVSFEAPAGKVTALLGPSGSGKSTLLRMVAGLETPDAGRLELDGEDATDMPVRERRVGFVFQSYALFAHMSVADNIAFGLQVRGRPKKESSENQTKSMNGYSRFTVSSSPITCSTERNRT